MSGRGGESGGARGDNDDMDALIRGIADEPDRAVTHEGIVLIVDRVAIARFDTRPVRVRPDLRGLVYRGRKVGSWDDALFYHLAQRVVTDGQWAYGTTEAEYLEDLRAAVRHPSAQIGVGTPSGSEPLVYCLSENVVPEERRGENGEALMFVLYGIGSGAIITGHQASSMEAIDFAKNVRWLR